MRCRWTREDWQSYLNDEINSQRVLVMETHLAHCSSCTRVYERVLLESMDSLEQAYGPVPDFTGHIMQRITKEEKTHSQPVVRTQPVAQTQAGTETQQITKPQKPGRNQIMSTKRSAPEVQSTSQEQQPAKRSPRTKQRVLLHYAIAASIALLFLSSGLFEKTVFYAEKSQDIVAESEQWMLNIKILGDEWLTELPDLFKGK